MYTFVIRPNEVVSNKKTNKDAWLGTKIQKDTGDQESSDYEHEVQTESGETPNADQPPIASVINDVANILEIDSGDDNEQTAADIDQSGHAIEVAKSHEVENTAEAGDNVPQTLRPANIEETPVRASPYGDIAQQRRVLGVCAWYCRKNKKKHLDVCAVDVEWGDWVVHDEHVTVTCGWGTLTRTYVRKCDTPTLMYGGQLCSGDHSETMTKQRAYFKAPCPVVDGYWAEWTTESVTICSQACGSGHQMAFRVRTCIPPSQGGNPCFGPDRDSVRRACNVHGCDNGYVYDDVKNVGDWTDWKVTLLGRCSRSCDGGVREVTKTRQCVIVGEGPARCAGPSLMMTQNECNTHACED
ncbi:adhesion G protein-coupled receptor B3-like isoform X2 [Gigantopelta aegis]|uniref:adhesion G protein-coupled receptor B3-like isoform X2 n=1 Tax=Gigantopelta aegis TaxID=1735272 RepID=UPI001B88A702|nr:adhesion G protein-coupled receptor B3-like isoform X2 [Gigantopelta aegis]